MPAPTIWTLKRLVDYCTSGEVTVNIPPSNEWVPSRPMGYDTWPARIKAAWMVLTGKADAVTWPGQ